MSYQNNFAEISQPEQPNPQSQPQTLDPQNTKRDYFLLCLLAILFLLIIFIAISGKQQSDLILQPPSHKIPEPKITLAIQTVFIMRENIPFLREWIIYHLHLGFDRFYLYDNTGTKGHITIPGYSIATENVNKYGFDFTKIIPYSDQQIQTEFQEILKDYGQHIVYIKWVPTNEKGEIIYGQSESIVHYLTNYGNDTTHTCFTDIDQFMFSRKNLNLKLYIEEKGNQGYHRMFLSQKKFMDRYCSPGRKITQIYECIDVDTNWWANKILVKNQLVSLSKPQSIHEIVACEGRQLYIPEEQWCFNHYNVNAKQLDWMSKFRFMTKVFKKCHDQGMIRYKNIIDYYCGKMCSDFNLILHFSSQKDVDKVCVNPNIGFF